MTHLLIARSWKAFGLSCSLVICSAISSAQISYKVSRTSVTFTRTAVGLLSPGQGVTVTNTGTVPLTIGSFSLSPIEFQLIDGWAPITLTPGSQETYQMKFAPDAAEKFTGQLTITINGVTTPIDVSLHGTGFATTAAVQVTPTTLNFGPQPLGTTSAPQTVTVTNVGTSNVMVTAAAALAPFSLSGFPGSTTLKPGQSVSVQVTFFATQIGNYSGTLVFSHDVVNSSGASLAGTAVAPSALAITSLPALPAATQSSAYNAVLTSAGGVGSVTWSLGLTSQLPSGLSLSGSGIISGTLASSVGPGTYTFAVEAVDSANNTSTTTLSLAVEAATGARCSNIVTDVAGTSSPIIPIPDLGTGTYLGSEGGLYPNGSNIRPEGHDSDGVAFADAIEPLDSNGNYSPTGNYVLLSIGMSATHTLFTGFQNQAIADASVNKNYLVLVNGAQDNATGGNFAQASHPVWADIMDYFLPQAGVTANQVVAAFVDDVSYPSGSFPGDMANLQANLESIAQNLHTKFPNIKLAYFASRMYGGYSNNPKNPESPEPYAYESGFAVKWSIQDQLNGLASLNYNPINGPVMAPWMDWGSYQWANGLTPRDDGFVWTCQDYVSDGIHPSLPPQLGQEKGANLIMNFFKNDDTTTPWFLAQ